MFADLCGYKPEDSKFSFDETTLAFQFFLRVFGRVRAKDLALKYNALLFKGKHDVNFRATIAAQSKKRGKEQGSKPKVQRRAVN